jgi:hypothetical protein
MNTQDHHPVVYNYLLHYGSREELLRMDGRARQSLLEQLLAEGPSEATWLAICELFATWPEGRERAHALAVAIQALDIWDPRIAHLDSSAKYLYKGGQLAELALLVRSISIYRRDERGNRELRSIAGSEYARNLRRLSIHRSELSDGSFQALTASPHLGRLEHLQISRTLISSASFEQLVQTSGFPNLRSLALVDVGLKPNWLEPTRQSIPFPYLANLNLSRNILGSEGLTLLAGAPWLASLRVLELAECFVRDDGIEALVSSPFWGRLEHLDLVGNPITGRAREQLLARAEEKGTMLIV